MDLLFGLDNLKRHQCRIDFVDNKLHFQRGSFYVEFLAEEEIKKHTLENEQQLDTSKFDQRVVQELTDMGFDKASIIDALTVCEGDKTMALEYLENQR